ncbi:MAG: MCE family protein [Desulfobacteraceae bacterium]|nr:MCE family protein [Desulfobacteraceae bacterium]
METTEEQDVQSGAIPLAVIQEKKAISLVWVIPLIAIIIAVGLVYKALTEKGPVITIIFKSAEGLEAGKTKIKHKDVVIGEIEAIKVTSDLKNVIVTAKLVKEAKGYLTDKTRFWVVRARVSGGIVSGLATLLSGSYIAIDPSLEGEVEYNFQGLEIPPVITSDLSGRYFLLKAPRLGSLEYGSPIYFKGIKVGQVVGYQFSDKSKDLEIRIFINAPYDENVFDTTRFWLASGLDMVIDSKGVRIDTQSFVSMMIGGLAFANPDQIVQGSIAGEGYIFTLYDTLEDAVAMKYTHKDYYLLKFDNSVRGLFLGAPVEFRGFPFGRVVDISLEMDWKQDRMKIPVKIEVEPERITRLLEKNEAPTDAIERLVGRGLRAQLKTGNLITGSKYISIDFFDTASQASIIVHGNLIEIPTIPPPLDELTGDLTAFLNKFSKIPIEEIGSATLNTIQSLGEASDGITQIVSSKALKQSINSLDRSLEQIRSLTSQLEQNLPSTVNDVSEQTIATLAEIQKLTASDSDIVFELKRTLKEFARAAQNISRLADHLERHPESIIQGKGKE